MTRAEIKNTPEIVELMLSESVMPESKEKLHKRLDEICNLAIKALEQEPRAEWIQKGIVGGGEYIYECSECHHTDTRSRILEVPFCWFCGARMEVEE